MYVKKHKLGWFSFVKIPVFFSLFNAIKKTDLSLKKYSAAWAIVGRT